MSTELYIIKSFDYINIYMLNINSIKRRGLLHSKIRKLEEKAI